MLKTIQTLVNHDVVCHPALLPCHHGNHARHGLLFRHVLLLTFRDYSRNLRLDRSMLEPCQNQQWLANVVLESTIYIPDRSNIPASLPYPPRPLPPRPPRSPAVCPPQESLGSASWPLRFPFRESGLSTTFGARTISLSEPSSLSLPKFSRLAVFAVFFFCKWLVVQ